MLKFFESRTVQFYLFIIILLKHHVGRKIPLNKKHGNVFSPYSFSMFGQKT
jgi:hypothetical protein